MQHGEKCDDHANNTSSKEACDGNGAEDEEVGGT